MKEGKNEDRFQENYGVSFLVIFKVVDDLLNEINIIFNMSYFSHFVDSNHILAIYKSRAIEIIVLKQ